MLHHDTVTEPQSGTDASLRPQPGERLGQWCAGLWLALGVPALMLALTVPATRPALLFTFVELPWGLAGAAVGHMLLVCAAMGAPGIAVSRVTLHALLMWSPIAGLVAALCMVT